jgi:hypothetical protein
VFQRADGGIQAAVGSSANCERANGHRAEPAGPGGGLLEALSVWIDAAPRSLATRTLEASRIAFLIIYYL